MQAEAKPSNADIAVILEKILSDMDRCVATQESIILEERAAMKSFNGDQLAALVERRARCQSELGELESRCQRLILLGSVGDKLEALIEHYVADTDAWQSLRVELVRRMQRLERDHVENHIRLRAAWNVTNSILQQAGVVEPQTSYQNVTYAANKQVIR